MASPNDEILYDSNSPVRVYRCLLSLKDGNISEKEDTLVDTLRECPLCHYYGRYFHCIDCVKSGNFTHSKKGLERFADKKHEKYKLDEKKNLIIKRYEKAIEKKKEIENVKFQIHNCKGNIQLLRSSIRNTKERLNRDNNVLNELKAQKLKCIDNKRKVSERITRLGEYYKKSSSLYRKILGKLQSKHSALEEALQRRIKELVANIFPITKVPSQHGRDSSLSSDDSPYAELEEAQKTTYIHGQWVITGSPTDDMQYAIVEPCIPSTGDYSAYTAWCADHKEIVACSDMSSNDINRFDIACGISAALAYTAQMVNIVAFYMDTHMPKRSSFGDFCRNQTPEKFLHNVAKLNANVLHLCLANSIDVCHLRSHRTISNLMLLLDPEERYQKCSTMKCLTSEEKEDVLESLEDCITKDLLPLEESDSESIEAEFVHISDEEILPEVPEAPQVPASFVSSVYSLWRAVTG